MPKGFVIPSSATLQRLARRLIEVPRDFYWDWLERPNRTPIRRLSKRGANKFLLGCIIDYQMVANQAWANARRLAEDVLGDPEDLWRKIGGLSEAAWQARRPAYRWLHRFPAAHHRIWRIGREVRDKYRGDARLIWKGRTPDEVRQRFMDLRLGAQLSKMAVGALSDTGHVVGKADVKADLNVCRVLGRLLAGQPFRPDEATKAARLMYPKNPWRLDAPLYELGRKVCGASPRCADCAMTSDCRFYAIHSAAPERPGR